MSALLTDQQQWDRIDAPWRAMDDADDFANELTRMPVGTVWPKPVPVIAAPEPEPSPVYLKWNVEWSGLFTEADYKDGYLAGLAELTRGYGNREFNSEHEARAEFERIAAALEIGPTPIRRLYDIYGFPVYEPVFRRVTLEGQTLSRKGNYRIWVTLTAWNERTGLR